MRFGTQAALFASLFILCGAVSAQTVQRSGNTYHVAACGGPAPAGYARCHAHIVTDRLGNRLADRLVPTGWSVMPSAAACRWASGRPL